MSIGNGAVIGMGAVVTRNVAAYSIVGGCPAKTIRMRFSHNVIDEFEKLKWWLFDDQKLEQLGPYIQEPLVFIEKASVYENLKS